MKSDELIIKEYSEYLRKKDFPMRSRKSCPFQKPYSMHGRDRIWRAQQMTK